MSGARGWLGSFGSCRSRIAGGILLAIAIGGALYCARMPNELQRFRAELRSKGYKVSRKEIAASQKGPSRNLEEITDLIRQLGDLYPANLPLMGRCSNAIPVPLTKRDYPWRVEDYKGSAPHTWEDLAKVMRQREPMLRRLQALAREEIPEYGMGEKTPIFGFISMARWLCADALSALRQGSRTTALEDMESITDFALFRSLEKDFIPQLGRIAVISIGLGATWEILQSAEWTEQDLVRIQAAWERVSPLQAIEAAMEGELAFADEMEPEMRKVMPAGNAMLGQLDATDDVLFIMQCALTHCEAARALQKGESWIALKPGLEQTQLKAGSKLNSRYRHQLLRLFLPKFSEFFANGVNAEAARQLLLSDVAIRRFKLCHNGTPPTAFRELSPDFLDVANGHDPFSGEDLQYCTNPDGSYLLYSVGIDGVDNGGDFSVEQGQNFFWESRDMVWPSSQ